MVVRNVIFWKTIELRMNNKKDFTSIVNELENIECTRNNKNKYTRKDELTSIQKKY